MCGIFGIISGKDSGLTPRDLKGSMNSLFRLSESRGREAAGLSVFYNGSIETYKKAVAASLFIKSREYKKFLGGIFGSPGPLDKPVAAIGHSRLVTNGALEDNSNNQPVLLDDIAVVHNGIIVNNDFLWKKFPRMTRRYGVDTEVIPALMKVFLERGDSFAAAVQEMFGQVDGAASIAMITGSLGKVALATNTGSLYICMNEKGTMLFFASERYILKRFLAGAKAKRIFKDAQVLQIKAGQGRVIDINNVSVSDFKLDTPAIIKRSSGDDMTGVYNGASPKTAVKENPPDTGGLRRCARCVLPETMPFIQFDEKGVCNYCACYKKIELKGGARLENILSRCRKSNGEPDCIVAFSGGRDSSFGLHYIKKVLKMTPIAFTYDWGMVTGLGRRNQARMCGRLGVEHMVISADIKRKRENIRNNILAWLKKPEAGMIPLFMAGDKQFYDYANRLRERTGVKLVIFCENKLEKTDFKMGFCGVDAHKYSRYGTHTVYNVSQMNKAKLAIYYAGRFIANPAYLNRSIPDTIAAYFSTYFASHDYLFLYEYIKWEEDRIVRTLVDEYGWELSDDTSTTWRIGDGSAPFYNYIYYKIAGFTEHDTFLSNQVREGAITRADALRRVTLDNRPRYKSIKEYLGMLGLDYDRVMEKIDLIAPLAKAGKKGHV